MKKTMIILLLFLLLGCSNETGQWKNGFVKKLEEFNAKHSQFNLVNFDYHFYQSIDRGDPFTEEEMIRLSEDTTIKPFLSMEEAIEDIEFYFKSLKYYYAGYEQFGGDEWFNGAKRKIISYINEENDKIDVRKLTKVMLKATSFVNDNHFTINRQRSNASSIYFSNEVIEFIKIEDYFIDKVNQRKVVAVNGSKDVDNYFNLSLNSEGELTYYFGVLLKEYPRNDYIVSYEDRSSDSIKVSAPYRKNKSEYSEDLDAEIPKVQIGSMFFEYGSNSELASDFLQSANKLKNEEVAILDLRNNVGGNGLLPSKWINNFLGLKVFLNGKGIYISDIDINDASHGNGELSQDMSEVAEYMSLYKLNGRGIYRLNDQYNQFVHNKVKLFVIMNSGSGSAAEYMIDLLHNVENVIFVGSNSAGCLVGSAAYDFHLPNSRINFSFGNMIRSYDTNYFKEFEGFKPDIYSNAEEIDELILKYVNKNRTL